LIKRPLLTLTGLPEMFDIDMEEEAMKSFWRVNKFGWCFGFLLLTGAVQAEEKNIRLWDVVTVLGVKEDDVVLPGSGARVDTEDIRKHSYDDVNRALRMVPGVYLREEDGFGLFPNISLRGVDTGRSQKVTVMEDGITIAPAPYSAPAAYYSPATGRMSAIEVLKGSSQVKYGPHTTGGVVNYLSTPIPEERSWYLKTLGGSDQEFRGHIYYGDKVTTDAGKFGVLVEQFYRENDGFKTIDTTPDFTDGDGTGFERSEPMLKLSWESPDDATRYQRLEGKIGYSDIKADETYLGLTEDDFAGNPYRRYAASRFDFIDTEHVRSYLRHLIDLSDVLSLTSTVYYNKFQRNWHKLQAVNGANLSRVLAGGGADLLTMKGEAGGTLTVRNNNRWYEQWGVQQEVGVDFNFLNAEHAVETGIGFHSDFAQRRQHDETRTQAADGTISSTVVGAPGSESNRREESEAIRFYLRDKITFGDLTLVPGFRYEWVDYTFIDHKSGEKGTSDLSVGAGGLGFEYAIDERLALFGGIHQGFSVPGPRDNARSGLKEETSLTTELGAAFTSIDQAFSGSMLYFHSTFDDLLVANNVGGGGAGVSENVGNVVSQGIEAKLQYDLGIATRKQFRNPYYVSFTYTNAELEGDSNSTDAESIFSGGKSRNKVPYIPEFQFSLGSALEFEKWGVGVDGYYVDSTFTTANNTNVQVNDNGVPDARFGKTDRFFIVDLSAHYKPRQDTKLFLNLHNVGDREYIVSRHPHGPRPGRPFTAYAGVELQF
jgi:Fe(3+) dicitrate transport protein